MPDISQMSTEELQKIAGTSSAPVSSNSEPTDITKIDTATLQKIAQGQPSVTSMSQDIESPLMKGAGIINAFGSQLRNKAMDSIGDMATLATNLMKGAYNTVGMTGAADSISYLQDKTGQAYTRLKESVADNPIDIQAQQQHPIASAVGSGTGYVGGMIASGAPISKAGDAIVGGALSKVAPTIMSSPIVGGAVNQGVQGAVLGAAANPDNPMAGAVSGLGVGAVLGGVGGALGAKLKRSGDVVDFEVDNITKAGENPNSVASIGRIQKSLKDNGIDMSKNQIQERISSRIQEKIASIDPEQNLNIMPSERLANLGKDAQVKATTEFNIQKTPLVNSTEKFQPSNLVAIKPGKSTIKLPDNLPAQASFDEMWTYRQKLDNRLTSAYKRLRKGDEVLENIEPIQDIRNAVTKDLAEAADKLGLKSNWDKLNDIYQTQILPAKAFKTKSGKLISELDVDNATTTLNRLMKAKNLDFDQIKKVAQSLGEDGKKLTGQAMLQRMYQDSMSDKTGIIIPKTFHSQLRKAKSLGIEDGIWDQETKDAAMGIRAIIDGADETLKIGSPPDAAKLFSDRIPSLLGSRPGIQLLKMIGSSKTPQTKARAIIQNILTGTLSIGKSRLDQAQPQEAQQ